MRTSRFQRLLMAIVLCAWSGACDSGEGSPTGPSSGAPLSISGQWSGTTSQGVPISFTVSPDQKVTAIVLGYRFNGCSGTHTLTDLIVDIGVPMFPPGTPPRGPTPPTSAPTFGYGWATPGGSSITQVIGSFDSNTTATGYAVFGEYPGCGDGFTLWNARR